jgi:hypothetical protein
MPQIAVARVEEPQDALTSFRPDDGGRALVRVATRLLALSTDPTLRWRTPSGPRQAEKIARELLEQAASR